VPIESQRTRRFEAVSVVWIVPLVALVAAAVIAWQAYVDRGPLIEIRFANASGIESGQTELRFRDVAVGLVEDVEFTSGLAEVSVFVRVNTAVAPYIDDGAEFWIVQPEVSTRGISGLDTVFSGVYIQGLWDDEININQSVFHGLAEPPLGAFEGRGLRIELRATGDTELTERIPILYKGIEVGQMGRARIARGGAAVFADAIIFEPYDDLVTSTTRFWDTSGVNFSIGAGGAEIDFGSIASILTGGITFDTLISGAEPVRDGVVFQVYSDEAAARASVFNQSSGAPLQLSIVFEENVAGLTVGAPVELGGVSIGEVTNLTGIVDPAQFGDTRVRLQTSVSIRPSRLGLPGEATPGAALSFLEARVSEGLRARLANASIFTGGLKVELVMDDDAPSDFLDRNAQPFPSFPSTENEVSDLTATAEGVLQRVGSLPIEELLENAIVFLDSATALVGNEDIQAVPGEARALLQDARGLLGSESTQAVPETLATTLKELETLITTLNEQDAAGELLAAFTAVQGASADFGTAIEGVPTLVERINAVAAKAEELPLEALTEELTGLVASAEAVLGTEAAKALPESLGAALEELSNVLTELREGGATENLNKTLASARTAADSIAKSAEDLPGVVDRLNATLAQANSTLTAYDKSSDLNRDARAALRAVQAAAQDVSSLARAIERQPNSLITGR
jgi:paraquat-inducible protein B